MNTPDVGAEIQQWLSQDLDKWTRHIVARHFDPDTGSPFWLRRAAELSFDPRDITRYEELTAFGAFDMDVLRTGDPAVLVPLAVPRPLAGMVWESGGTTGDPCRVFYTEPILRHKAYWRRWQIERAGFEWGRNWLVVTPTGPHTLGHSAFELTELSGGRVYRVDFDPRWVKRQVRAGLPVQANEYTEHVIAQATAILRSQPVDYLITTPAVFQTLIRTDGGLAADLRGAWLCGTHATPAMWCSFADVLAGKPMFVMYGNTFGNTFALPVEQDGEIMPHVPTFPQITMSVVGRDDWRTPVSYGGYGRVRLTVLHEDLFVPNILERDLAMRYDTGADWPCDGVANVRPYQAVTSAVEGIY